MAWDRQSILERCAVSAATAWGFYLMARFVNHRWHMTALEQQLRDAQASLEHERLKRKADRVGRIRAEQELRAVKVQLQQLQLQLRPQPSPQLQPQQGNLDEAEEEQDEEHDQEHEVEEEEGVPDGTSKAPREAASGSSQGAEVERESSCGGDASGPGPTREQQGRREVQQQGQRRGRQARAVTAPRGVETAAGSSVTGGNGVEASDTGGEDDAAVAAVVEATAPGDMKRTAAAAAAALAAAGSAMPAFPFRPIGHLQSVFSERNGTPRQPQLVPAARSRLVLSPNVPRACLEGLEQYSHCWVLYVFHANTDLAKYLSQDRSGLKAKIHVPRLNGGRMGVLATRSPHRPSPIGLSTAEVIRVEGNTLVLGGTDIVDGSPVLDIKPYVPFCDCLTGARAPSWVQAEADDEPLAVGAVVIGEAARAALLRAWDARRAHSMYGSAEQYIELVKQVLSRDIRSVHQRLNVKPCTTAAAAAGGGASKAYPPAPPPAKLAPHAGSTFALKAAPSAAGAAAAGFQAGAAPGEVGLGQYHVVLENIYIRYDMGPTGAVEVYDAWVDPITAR